MSESNAKSVEDSIIPTLSHEITHWMKYKMPTLYNSIREDVMKTLAEGNEDNLTESELVSREMDRIKKNHPEIDVTPESAIDELVARACEDMLSNSNAAKKLVAKMGVDEQHSFIEKVKETFENLIKWVNDLLAHYKSNSEEAKILREYKNMLKKISKQWDAMLLGSIESNQALQKEGITGEKLANKTSNNVQEMARDNFNVKYYQNFLDDLPVDEYNKLTTKKPIKVAKKIKNAIESARIERYADFVEEDIPIIDVINLGEYNVLNSNDYYFIRNADKYNFSVVKHSKTIKRRQDKYANIGNGQARNKTHRGSNIGNESKGIEGKHDKSNSNNRPSIDQRTLGKNVESSQRMEEADRRIGVGKGIDNLGRGIKRSDRDTDTFSYIQTLQRAVNELRDILSEMQNSEDFKVAHDKLSEAVSNGDVENGIKAYKEWQEKSGYAELSQRRDTLQLELENLRKSFNEEIANKALNEEKEAIAKSGLSEADYFRKQAVKEFGYTPYFYDAGYITPNGKMLNFSGEKGKHYGTRGQDHRAIGIIYAETSGTDALNRFMKDGNVRIMAESPGIDISTLVEPTTEQYSTIKKFIYEYANKEFFNVDLSDENGNVIGSLKYENKINPSRIINDIKHYYATGEIREQSNIDKFRYSDRDNDIDVDTQINQSMTMAECKDMIQRAFALGDIYDWYEGEYKNGDEWLKGEGVDEVALNIENEYTLLV